MKNCFKDWSQSKFKQAEKTQSYTADQLTVPRGIATEHQHSQDIRKTIKVK